MTIQRFEIELDNSTHIYQNGSVIDGKIYLDLDEPKNARVSKKETYIVEDVYLIGSQTEEMVIPAGKHVYPFSYKLAENIPASFKTDVGKITYKIRASIVRLYLWNHRRSIEFHVNDSLDLNLDPEAPEPVRKEICKDFLVCVKPVYLVAMLPVRGYIPGETIPITIDLRNEAEVNLKEVYIRLIKWTTYHAGSKTYIDKDVICNHEIPLENEKRLETRIQHFLQVPSLNPSYLRHAKLIDIDYFVRIKVRVGGLHRNFKLNVPVIIGTVPLLASTVSKAIDENEHSYNNES